MKKRYLYVAMGCIMASACSTKSTNQHAEETRTQEMAPVNTFIGNRFSDISLPDTEGKEVKLSQLVAKNRYTLVEFWESSSDSCLQEIPHLASSYNDFHNRGLGVVSVSLDENKESWKAAIEKHHMTWNHLVDAKGWNGKAALQYGVTHLPAMVLIDQNGIIIARDLKGEQLENKLMELMGC